MTSRPSPGWPRSRSCWHGYDRIGDGRAALLRPSRQRERRVRVRARRRLPAEGGVLMESAFAAHRVRGRLNAGFFAALDGYINWLVRDEKRKVFADLPGQVVEVWPGVGANFAYLPSGCHLMAVEPNPHMHRQLKRRAARRGIEIQVHSVTGDVTGLDDRSVDAEDLLRHRHQGLAPGGPGADGGAPPRGRSGHPVRARARSRRFDSRGDADPAAGLIPPVLLR